MRALRPMTTEEQEFAEQKHDLVIDFLRCKRLPMDDFYDVVVFGYLSAVTVFSQSAHWGGVPGYEGFHWKQQEYVLGPEHFAAVEFEVMAIEK